MAYAEGTDFRKGLRVNYCLKLIVVILIHLTNSDAEKYYSRYSRYQLLMTTDISTAANYVDEDQSNNRPVDQDRETYNERSRFIEVVFVYDNKAFQELGTDMTNIHTHATETAKQINTYFAPLDLYLMLMDVVVWSNEDEIEVSYDSLSLLPRFASYRENTLNKAYYTDYAQLLTGEKFINHTSRYYKGMMCNEKKGIIVTSVSNDLRTQANYMTRAIAGELDVPLDHYECDCPTEHCIMNSFMHYNASAWSSCSNSVFRNVRINSNYKCLRNKPDRIFHSPWLEAKQELEVKEKLERHKAMVEQLQQQLQAKYNNENYTILERQRNETQLLLQAEKQVVVEMQQQLNQTIENHLNSRHEAEVEFLERIRSMQEDNSNMENEMAYNNKSFERFIRIRDNSNRTTIASLSLIITLLFLVSVGLLVHIYLTKQKRLNECGAAAVSITYTNGKDDEPLI